MSCGALPEASAESPSAADVPLAEASFALSLVSFTYFGTVSVKVSLALFQIGSIFSWTCLKERWVDSETVSAASMILAVGALGIELGFHAGSSVP